MIKVEKYIEKLLLSHDCVIIPGLGGFVAQYEPSYRVDEDGSFYPPYRTIGFNAQLKMNDGLLAQIYMQTFDTNFPEATRMVEQESDKIKKNLRADGCHQFENIGRLELTSDNNILFVPESKSGIVAPDFYGLDTFRMPPYVKEAVADKVNSQTTGPLKQPCRPVGNAEKRKKQRNSQYVIRLNRRWTNYAAVALIAILSYFTIAIPVADRHMSVTHNIASSTDNILYGFPVKKLMQTKQRSVDAVRSFGNVAAPKVATTENTLVKKDLATTKNTGGENITEELSKSREAKEHESVIHDETDKNSYYTIVLASSVKASNARIFIRQLKADGYKDAGIYEKKSMRRVIYSKYATQEAAQKALRHLRDNETFERAWVLKIK